MPTTSVPTAAAGASAALAVADAAYAVLMQRRARIIDAVFGPSTGVWADWGIGLVAGYATAHAAIAVRPTPAALRTLSFMRAVLIPGHVVAIAKAEPRRRVPLVGFLVMNAAVAAVAYRASSVADARASARPAEAC